MVASPGQFLSGGVQRKGARDTGTVHSAPYMRSGTSRLAGIFGLDACVTCEPDSVSRKSKWPSRVALAAACASRGLAVGRRARNRPWPTLHPVVLFFYPEASAHLDCSLPQHLLPPFPFPLRAVIHPSALQRPKFWSTGYVRAQFLP